MKVVGRLLVLAIGFVLAACGGAADGGSPTTSVSASDAATPSASFAATSTPSGSAVPSDEGSDILASCFPLPHEAVDLEAMLPKSIAGRQLALESYHGAKMVICINGGTAADVAAFEADLVAEGLTLDDVSVVVAGRSDVQSDPPYFILAYQATGYAGKDWPPTIGLDNPDAAAFQEADLGGKHVLVGSAGAVEQSEHSRGRPYVWDSPTVHYLIVTDDEAWAEEALQALE